MKKARNSKRMMITQLRRGINTRFIYVVLWCGAMFAFTVLYRSQIALTSMNYPSPEIEKQLKDEVTVVTAFFDIGTFFKENAGKRTNQTYTTWMKIFSRIKNPVIAYFDAPKICEHFNRIRKFYSNITQIHCINRSQVMSFDHLEEVRKIYADPHYPKHAPDTTLAEYAVIMHAKYELTMKSIQDNPFQTKYFAWADIGVYRDLPGSKVKAFEIIIPPGYRDGYIAYTMPYKRNPNLTPSDIFRKTKVLVCGAFFLGYYETLHEWCKHYLDYVNVSLSRGLSSSDQQVVYAMLNDKDYHVPVGVQFYTKRPNVTLAWHKSFHLAHVSKTNKSDISLIDFIEPT